MARSYRNISASAKRTHESSPAIYRWVRHAHQTIESVQRTTEIQSGLLRIGSFSRPLHGLFPRSHATLPALKCWAIIIRPLRGLYAVALRRTGYLLPVCLLLTAHCSLLTVDAQPGMPQPNSPLYGARPESGPVSTGLPKALKSVGIDQRLNEQIPLDAVFKDEQGHDVHLSQFFKGKPVVLSLV